MNNQEIRQLPKVVVGGTAFYVTIALSECGKQYEVFVTKVLSTVPETARHYTLLLGHGWDSADYEIYQKATLNTFPTFNPDARHQRWLFKNPSKAVQAAKRWHRKFEDVARAEARKAQREITIAERYKRQREAAAQRLAEAFEKLGATEAERENNDLAF